MDRVIQSSTAGTTRDVITAPLMLPEGEVALRDSAGLGDITRDADAMGTTDVDGQAQAVSRRSIAQADLVLLVVDATDEPAAAVGAIRPTLPNAEVLIVLNKIDALPPESRSGVAETAVLTGPIVSVSAMTGAGIGDLKGEIARLVFAGGESHGSDVLALSNRQRSALNDAHDALRRAAGIIDDTRSTTDRAELLALEVREAMNMLSLLVGEVTTEEMLGRIFSRFCIGK
jgi:tRNA modification GTPase